MKIIEQGKNLKTDIERKFHCNTCGCEFIAEKGEYYYEVDKADCAHFAAYCPNCKTCVGLNVDDV